jgi:hypothetical protein
VDDGGHRVRYAMVQMTFVMLLITSSGVRTIISKKGDEIGKKWEEKHTSRN